MRYRFIITLLLIFATLAIFWPATGFDFVNWDDRSNITNNQYLNPVTVDNTLHFWHTPYFRTYTPNTYTLYAFLGFLSQQWKYPDSYLNPHIFHTANITLHIFNALLLFTILRILLTSGFREQNRNEETDRDVDLAATLGALIFALHPVQVESVLWITSMGATLSGFFSFLCIRWYLAFAFASKEKNEDGRKYFYYTLSCAALIMAFLSKPSAVVVPPIVFLLDRWAVKRSFKQIAISLSGWFIAAGLFAIVTKSAQHSDALFTETELWAKPLIAADALAFYIYKFIWPLDLGIDYGRSPSYVMEQWWFYATWLVPVFLLAMLFFIKQRTPYFISLGIFAVSFLPVLGFIPFLFQGRSTVADRYYYLPMLGVALAVSRIIYVYKTKGVVSICLLAIFLFGVRSYGQVYTWKDGIALFNNAIKVNPRSFLAYNNLGTSLKEQGKLDEAISMYQKSIEINRDSPGVYYNIANAMEKLGRTDEAVSNYAKAIWYRPDYPDAYYNLGIAQVKLGKLSEAIFSFEKTIKLEPDYADAHYNIGAILKGQGKPGKAASYFRNAITVRSDFPEAHNRLGEILGELGKLDEAIFHFSETIKLQPGDANAHYNLGVASAMKGDMANAEKQFSETLRIKPNHQGAKRSLERIKAARIN